MNDSFRDDESLFPEADIIYSTFWNRFGASLIDGFILILISLPVTYFNIISWKIPVLFIAISLITILYKPFLEYRYGATLGKMAVGLRVVGHEFGKITLKEELMRISFYLVPSVLQHILTLSVYFSPAFHAITGYREFNRYMGSANPANLWINGIVFILVLVDCFTFISTRPGRFLHDIYAGTNVIEKRKN
jgi:uncharacterized RDD family membrane protein YckC